MAANEQEVDCIVLLHNQSTVFRRLLKRLLSGLSVFNLVQVVYNPSCASAKARGAWEFNCQWERWKAIDETSALTVNSMTVFV